MAKAPHPNSKKPHLVRQTFLRGNESLLEGSLDSVIEKLQKVRKEAIKVGCTDMYISVDADLACEWDGVYTSVEVEIQGRRPETQEEIDSRRAAYRKKSEASKKAVATRKKKKEEEERKLYEELKKKFK